MEIYPDCRLVPKHRLISISIFEFPLDTGFLMHNWISKHLWLTSHCLFLRVLYSHSLGVQNQTYTCWVHLMEHICLEVQSCIEIQVSKRISNMGILVNLCLRTGLQIGFLATVAVVESSRAGPAARIDLCCMTVQMQSWVGILWASTPTSGYYNYSMLVCVCVFFILFFDEFWVNVLYMGRWQRRRRRWHPDYVL